MGVVAEEKEGRVRIHLRGYPEELDRWFDPASPSLIVQEELKRNAVGSLPHPTEKVLVNLVDRGTGSVSPIGTVLESYAARDTSLITFLLASGATRVAEIGNSYVS